ncbi:MAG: hypothetical protein FJZ04_00485 [Candidatus Moranbacteria bacterium]|nr:hypothetical protein [Candidatus Moranbacteria bacterium]
MRTGRNRKIIFLAVAAIAAIISLLLIFLPSTSSRQIGLGSSFFTASLPSDGDNFEFAVIGDTQKFNPGRKNGGLQKAAEGIGRKKAAFTLAMGDLATDCKGGKKCEKNWRKWKKIVLADVPEVYPVMGNHDQIKDEAYATWRRVFNLPDNGPEGYQEIVYSFDYGNSHFVVLNSGTSHSVNKEQRDWLEEDLDSNQKENIFVFFHEPAWPTGDKIGESLDVHPEERDELWGILDRHGVAAVFSGHEHLFSRRKITAVQFSGAEKEIYQFIVGNTDSFRHGKPRKNKADYYFTNKSYALVQVNGSEITVKNYSIGGRKMDEFKFTR